MQKIFANPIRLARYLFIILAAVLDVLAVVLFMSVEATSDTSLAYTVYSFLMFVEAAVMLICGFGITKSKRLYWLAVIVLALNIGLTAFDQFGIVDLFFILFNAFTLYVLLAFRKEFIAPPFE
jgi:hypothetical protein